MGYIIIVDDDKTRRSTTTSYFRDQNISVRAASSPSEFDLLGAKTDVSVIILYLQAGEDGIDFLRRIRSRSNVPIIIVAGCRLDERDSIICFELGADDYITERISLRELLARVHAIARRAEMGCVARVRNREGGGYSFGGWHVVRRGRTLVDPFGEPVSLSKGEYALLEVFLEAPQRILTREQLLEATRVCEDISDRSIDVRILRLRRKLDRDPRSPSVIQAERGVGYIFTQSVKVMLKSQERALMQIGRPLRARSTVE